MTDLIEYELINHECYYTYDLTDVTRIIKSYYDLPLHKIHDMVKEVFDATIENNKNIDTKHKSIHEELIDKGKKMIAIKSGYYFMLFEKDKVPFFDDLEKTNRIVNMDNKNYSLYQATNWDLSQKVDELMGIDDLGYGIDEYLVDKDINI